MQHSRGFPGKWLLPALLLALLAVACSRASPEQAVRAQVAALQAAIDARDAGEVEALLAADFVGNDGIDRRGAKQLAAAVFLRHRDVAAKLGPVSVELRGETDAIATFSVLATGGSGGLLPDRLASGGWRVEAAQRQLDAQHPPVTGCRPPPAGGVPTHVGADPVRDHASL